jgi:hypothetical protein
MTAFDLRLLARSRAARSRERLQLGKRRSQPVSSMSSLAIVRELVKRILKARNYSDEDDDDPE